MADFNTHIAGATLATGLFATACLGADVIDPPDAVALWAVGTIGGVLPDIDSDHSHALRLVFGLMGIGTAAAVLLMFADHLSILELWLSCCLMYGLVRYGASRLFAKLTVHRGVFHSVLASMAMALVVVHLARWVGGRGPLMAWMMGFMAFVGCLVHLILDEMYSVDLVRQRVKKSFGTAFKMFDRRSPKASAAALGSVVVLSLTAPSPDLFARFLFSAETYERIGSRLWPSEGWFQEGHGVVHPRWHRPDEDMVPPYLLTPEEREALPATPIKDVFYPDPMHHIDQPERRDAGAAGEGSRPPTESAVPAVPGD
ncbi:MAG: metal-dependent hydrolase [Bradymonadia bacterium]